MAECGSFRSGDVARLNWPSRAEIALGYSDLRIEGEAVMIAN